MKAHRTISTFLLCFFTGFLPLYAQENNHTHADSSKVYENLDSLSHKNGFTRFLYRLVLRPETPAATPKNKDALKKSSPNLDQYNTKIIRQISVIVTDPFGYALLDTSRKPEGYFQKGGNSLHLKTGRSVVRNMLLIKSGQEYEAYSAAESERLLRQSGLFRDVIIYPIADTSLRDSVDIIVRCVDRWSIYFRIVASTAKASFRITDRNIGGSGHTFASRFDYNTSGLLGYAFRYDVNRIGKTYITSRIYYEKTSDVTRSIAVSAMRPFYSPVTKWSYGATFFDLKYPDELYYNREVYSVPEVNNSGYDMYLSRSIRLFQQGGSFEKAARFTNLILSTRYIDRDQDADGPSLADSLSVYRPLNYYLGMLAISTIYYEQENYILRFGEKEDMQLGQFAGVIAGFDQVHESQYAGIRVGIARYHNLWYYTVNASAGEFFESNGTVRSAVNLRFTAFSPLLMAGKWKFRQFIRGGYTTGMDMPANNFLLLSNGTGLDRVNTTPLIGYNRLAVSIQSHAYAPVQLIGFRFAPVLFANGGLISNHSSQLIKSPFYSSFGIGLLVRNDHLINNTFQVSLSFYPNLFGTNNSSRISDFSTNTFQLPVIQIDRPEFVTYN